MPLSRDALSHALLSLVTVLCFSTFAGSTYAAPPHPSKDPGVLAAEANLRNKTKEMEQARQQISKLRVQMGRMQSLANMSRIKAQRGNGIAGQVTKTDEIIEAEKKLADVTRTMNELLDKLHKDYQYEDALVLRKERAGLQQALADENELSNPSISRLKLLTSKLRTCERNLEKIEIKLFQHDEDYKNIRKEFKEAGRLLAQAKNSDRSTRLQPASRAQPDQNKLAIQQEIQAAIEVYSLAERAYRDARSIAKEKEYAAIKKYRDWKVAEAKKKKDKNNKGKGRKGRNKNKRGHR